MMMRCWPMSRQTRTWGIQWCHYCTDDTETVSRFDQGGLPENKDARAKTIPIIRGIVMKFLAVLEKRIARAGDIHHRGAETWWRQDTAPHRRFWVTHADGEEVWPGWHISSLDDESTMPSFSRNARSAGTKRAAKPGGGWRRRRILGKQRREVKPGGGAPRYPEGAG